MPWLALPGKLLPGVEVMAVGDLVVIFPAGGRPWQ